MQTNPEQAWEKFIEHLNKTSPLGKKGEGIEHVNFIGSIEKYKKIFLEANHELPGEADPIAPSVPVPDPGGSQTRPSFKERISALVQAAVRASKFRRGAS